MKQYFPILDWLPNYKRTYLAGDLSAGLTVGIMLIPQGMAYAMIAGLPPVYGLYAALLPQVVYAVFGTSRQLAVGPVAMDSLLVAAGISTMAVAGTEEYITLALLLALMMGLIQLVFGLARLGFLVNFLSKPVISGFTSAAALIIGLSQLKHLVGVDLGRSDSVFMILYRAFQNFGEINWITVSIGLAGIVIIKGIKKLNKTIPSALVVVVFGILLVYLGQLQQFQVKIVEAIPSGLPGLHLPTWNPSRLYDLFPVALTLALIAFMEAISVAKALQARHAGEYEIRPSQEMIALGMSNIVGSLFGSYPTTGGFSRSAVNDQAGARTNLAALVSAGLIGLTLLFLTPLFYYLPNAVLASIIMVAVFGLIDVKYPRYLWKVQKQDFLMLLTTFLATLLLGIMQGIGVGVVLSLVLLISRTAQPHFAVLGKLRASEEYRNVNRFEEVQVRADILVIRYDAPLFYANINHFVQTVREEVTRKGDTLKLFVLNGESIHFMDTTALYEFSQLINELSQQEIKVYLAGLIGPVRDLLTKAGFIQQMGADSFFTHTQEAVDYYDQKPEVVQNCRFHISTQSNFIK